MQKYQILGLIGEGAYGVVLRCKSTETKEIVAIKKFKESEEDEIVKKTTLREVKVLRMLNQENIVQLKQAFRKKGIVCLVFQYLPYNLLQVLQKSPSGLDPQQIRSYVYQILKGIAYMHHLNVVHRDIKPQNLLVNQKNIVKICDFGFARPLAKFAANASTYNNSNAEEEVLTDYVATRWYRPPQLLVGAPYGKQIDLWAIGCIMGELVDGMPLFPGENQIDQLFLIQKCIGPLTPDHKNIFLQNPRFLGMKFPEITSLDTIQKRYLGKLSPKALNFMKGILKMNPAERLSAVEALKHPYFDGLREEDFMKKVSDRHAETMSASCNTRTLTSAMPKQELGSTTFQRKKTTGSPYQPVLSREQEVKSSERNSRLGSRKKEQLMSRDRPILQRNVQNNTSVESKSVSKPAVKRTSNQKALSLEKHHKKDVLLRTQGGAFYIQPAIQEQTREEEEEQESRKNEIGRNKIYGAKYSNTTNSHNSDPLTQQNGYNKMTPKEDRQTQYGLPSSKSGMRTALQTEELGFENRSSQMKMIGRASGERIKIGPIGDRR